MTKSQIHFSYSILQHKIAEKLKETNKTLKRLGYETQHFSPKEFYDYMTGETPTGDTITIVDVLDNEFLMIHEVVEISELRKMSIPTNKNTVVKFHPKVYEAHFTATEQELNYAFSKKDFDWLKVRMNHAKSWLEDNDMPQYLLPTCKAIIEKLSNILRARN